MARFNERLYGSRSATNRNQWGAIAFGVIAVLAGLTLVLMGNAGGWAPVAIGVASILIVTLLPKVFGESSAGSRGGE
jgi:hypothetical protein